MRKLEEIAFGEGTFADAVRLHKMWLEDEEGGKRLVVPAGFDLGGANLGGANLGGANLEDANLEDANLGGANLGGANLEDANLGGANLEDANLGGANLRGANLGGANLEDIRSAFGAVGNREHLKSMQIERYSITYDTKFLQIGCQRHTIERWREFSPEQIRVMDGEAAVVWWTKWKEVIFTIIEMSPARPTGYQKPQAAEPSEPEAA